MGDINIGNGAMEMDTEAVTSAMTALTQAGQTFESAWKAAEAAISASEGGIGSDKMARQFRDGTYRPAKEALWESTNNVKPCLDAFAEGGNLCRADYEERDRAGSDRIRNASAQ